MDARMKIRQYRPGDKEAVWHLHNLALEGTGAHLGNGPWDDDLRNIEKVYIDNGGDFLVGDFEGTLVAMGALKRTDPHRVQLKRMRIHPECQRRGFGQLMVRALEERAVVLGFQIIHLDTTTIQIAAQKLYEKNGFVKVGEDRIAQFDVLLYEKSLPTTSSNKALDRDCSNLNHG